jgi:hypothetical protein
MVPTFTWGLVRSNLFLDMSSSCWAGVYQRPERRGPARRCADPSPLPSVAGGGFEPPTQRL